jgi:two-component system LytT family response regulator
MRTLIVDDERLARNELKRLLEPYTKIEIVGEAANAEEALVMIEDLQPELLFLDIQMPGKNGFELLSSIEGKSPEVIFTTAYDEYAIKAFEFNALDYLLKPIDTERLKETIHRIEENQAHTEIPVSNHERVERILGENDQVFVKDGGL